MGKDPAFLFYPGDWLGGTIGMTLEEKGAYMELLMLQFSRGHMTIDMFGQTVGHLWVKVQDKFVQDANGLWYNVRLETEKEKRKNFVSSRKNNKEGKNQHNNPESKAGHMTSHMENENRNEDINLIKSRVKDSIFKDEVFMGEINRMHKGKNLQTAFDQCWLHFSQMPNMPQDWEWRQKFSSWLTRYKSETEAPLKLNKIQ